MNPDKILKKLKLMLKNDEQEWNDLYEEDRIKMKEWDTAFDNGARMVCRFYLDKIKELENQIS